MTKTYPLTVNGAVMAEFDDMASARMWVQRNNTHVSDSRDVPPVITWRDCLWVEGYGWEQHD